jgi:hypothetical protein
MAKGRRAPLHRVLCLAAAPVLAAGVFAARVQPAGAGPVFACPHFQATWSFTPPSLFGTPYSISVGGASCVAGASTGTATDGAGTVTVEEPGGVLFGTAVVNHYVLSLSVGGAPVSTVFDATLVAQGIPGQLGIENLAQEVLAGPVQFEGATGSGLLTERCAYNAFVNRVTCTDEGFFASE